MATTPTSFDVVEGDMTKAEIVDFSDEEDEITMDFGDLFHLRG